MGQKKNSQIVYSTAGGRICPGCGQPEKQCQCTKSTRLPPGDGIVRVRREVKGRRGKTVTSITGIPLPEDSLKGLASRLKRLCGTGGSVKDGIIIIQGDHRSALIPFLQTEGFQVKRAGG